MLRGNSHVYVTFRTTSQSHFHKKHFDGYYVCVFCVFPPDVPAGPPYQAGLGSAPVTLTPDGRKTTVNLFYFSDPFLYTVYGANMRSENRTSLSNFCMKTVADQKHCFHSSSPLPAPPFCLSPPGPPPPQGGLPSSSTRIRGA